MPRADNQWENNHIYLPRTEKAQFKARAAVQLHSVALLHCLHEHPFNEHSFSACLGNKSFVTFSSTHFTLTTFPSRQHRYHNLNSHSLFGYVSVNSFFLPFSFYFFFLPFAWIHQFKSNLTVSPCSLSLNAYIPQASALLLFSPNSKVVPLALHTNIFFSFHFLHRFLLCP